MINFRANLGMNTVGSTYVAGLVLDVSTWVRGQGFVREYDDDLRN